MIGLILKDLIIQKKMLLLSLVFVAAFIVMFQKMDNPGMMAAPIMIAITYLFVTNSCALDEKNRADIIINSLPVSRTEIVGARYISVLVFLAAAALLYMAETGFFRLLSLSSVLPAASPLWIFTGAATAVLILSIYLPMFFSMGFTKSRIFYFVLFFGVFFGLGPALNSITGPKDPTALLSVIYEGMNPLVLGFTAGGTILLIFFLSFQLSCKLYRRREF